ncbi:MAG TPA: hypothetical protein DCP90_03115 [Clostridiales bacterium]|nr:MAG: hypothetical protein A2Y22_07410 [Clostridiales bacterium GWD2_32_59]HAN09585.1 hypothetical protein [Clostridiales bacterium]
MSNTFYDRINCTDIDLENISNQICEEYKLGKLISNVLIETGYGDFNYILESQKGKIVVKILSKDRIQEFADRYIKTMEITIERGINHPKLYNSKNGTLHMLKIHENELKLCVMEYIDGQDLYSANQKATIQDIQEIGRQLAIINQLEIKPEFVYDSWAIINFKREYELKKKYLNDSQVRQLEELYDSFRKIDIEALPHSFVHGDVINTNVNKAISYEHDIDIENKRESKRRVIVKGLKNETEKNVNIVHRTLAMQDSTIDAILD